MTNAARLDVNQGQNKGGEGKSRETQGSWVGKLAVRWAVEARLEFTTKGGKAKVWVVGSNVGERVATIVIWHPLLGHCSSVIDRTGAVYALLETRAALQ